MASVKKSVLMEYLQCTLCMEDMQRSCILQCHHSFCVDCLQKYMAQATDTQKMTCPICRKVTTLPDGDLTTLPPNFFMDNLKDLITKETDDDIGMIDKDKVSVSADREALVCSLEDCQGEAVMYCTVDQEYLCQTCADEHASHRFTRKHKTIKANEANKEKTPSAISQHPCGRHPDQILNMYCKTCHSIVCFVCCTGEHKNHDLSTLHPFVKPCDERLDAIMKRIDKLLKCVDLARQRSQQQVDKAQHHIVSLKTQVTITFQQIRKKRAQQEERLMSDLEIAATKVDKVASSTHDEQQLVEVSLESLRFLGRSLTEGDVYDQMINLPNLEEAVEKRWRTEIPGVMWKDQSAQDEKKINMSDVDHLILTETSHTTSVLPCLEEGAVNVTGAVCDKPDQQKSETEEDGEITRFNVGGYVNGICHYNNTIFTAKGGDSSLYMYSSTGVLIKKHVINGMKYPSDLTLRTHDDGDKLIITDYKAKCLHLVPVEYVGNKCELGTTQSQKLNCTPYAVYLNNQNNLVVADMVGQCLHVYNNSGQRIRTVRLPSGVKPRYLSAVPSGGYVIIGNVLGLIIWVDEEGDEKKRHQGTACGIALSSIYCIARDIDNRYIVADHSNNQLLLFSEDGGNIRCLIKDQIRKPYSLFLDHQLNKLYVGTEKGEVVIYDYYMLLGEKHPVKYIINTICVNIKTE